ncbi:MAG: FHA domain-containing protein [Muribaculaceae bacterium]|nr:FHA domain-containing protein [Muribaculaceae bacterium]
MPVFYLGHDHEDPIKIDKTATTVSRNHATIEVDNNNNWILTDTNSANGTFVEQGGEFRRINRIRITPDTWIRLGAEGIYGYSFKARRVMSPNDYRHDFRDLKHVLKEFKAVNESLERKTMMLRYIVPLFSLIALGFSFIPAIGSSPIGIRAVMIVPGMVAPFLQGAFLTGLRKRKKQLQSMMICPKCRRRLSEDDIVSGFHNVCKAK